VFLFLECTTIQVHWNVSPCTCYKNEKMSISIVFLMTFIIAIYVESKLLWECIFYASLCVFCFFLLFLCHYVIFVFQRKKKFFKLLATLTFSRKIPRHNISWITIQRISHYSLADTKSRLVRRLDGGDYQRDWPRRNLLLSWHLSPRYTIRSIPRRMQNDDVRQHTSIVIIIFQLEVIMVIVTTLHIMINKAV